MNQYAEACGCVVTTNPGHVHTKLCAQHRIEFFSQGNIEDALTPTDPNLDLIS
jgi:hypothetical protein